MYMHYPIAPVKSRYLHNISLISPQKTFVVRTHYKYLTEVLLMSTHNIHFFFFRKNISTLRLKCALSELCNILHISTQSKENQRVYLDLCTEGS